MNSEYGMWQERVSEITNNMSSELTGSESGLVAYYNFNQGVAGGTNTGVTSLNDGSYKCC